MNWIRELGLNVGVISAAHDDYSDALIANMTISLTDPFVGLWHNPRHLATSVCLSADYNCVAFGIICNYCRVR
jgi:hypothetical protein